LNGVVMRCTGRSEAPRKWTFKW